MRKIVQLSICFLILGLNMNCKSVKGSRDANKIVSLRWGTLGITKDNHISFYEIENKEWKRIDMPEFEIPEHDDLLFIDLGKIGVIKNDRVLFYSVSEGHKWEKDSYEDFLIPDDRAMIPIGLGTIGVLEKDHISFYGFKEGSWKKIDEKVSNFDIPQKGKIIPLMLDPLGIASLGILNNKTLKIYHYYPKQKQWKLSDFTFEVPQNEGLVSIGFGSIGFVKEGKIKFYPLEAKVNDRLIRDKIEALPDFEFKSNK